MSYTFPPDSPLELLRFVAVVKTAYPDAELLHVATILWEGWGTDNYFAILQSKSGTKFAVHSSHGKLVPTDERPLRHFIDLHFKAVSSQIAAYNMLCPEMEFPRPDFMLTPEVKE